MHGQFTKYSKLVQFEARSEERIAFLSNTIQRNHSLQHFTCDMCWESGFHEDWRRVVQQTVPISEVTAKNRTHAEFASWTSGSFQFQSENIRRPSKAKEARGKWRLVARSSRRLEAVTWPSESKVYHTQEFRKKTMIAEKWSRNWSTNLIHTRTVTRWWRIWTRLKNSTNSAKSPSSMGNTEYFDLCEISSIIVYCTCGKWQLNKDRYDVLSFPSYLIKRIRPMEPDMDQRCGRKSTTKTHDMLKKAAEHKCSTILGKVVQRRSLPQFFVWIGWNEDTVQAHDKIALEDHSYTATREERSRNEKSWKLSLNAEGKWTIGSARRL